MQREIIHHRGEHPSVASGLEQRENERERELWSTFLKKKKNDIHTELLLWQAP